MKKYILLIICLMMLILPNCKNNNKVSGEASTEIMGLFYFDKSGEYKYLEDNDEFNISDTSDNKIRINLSFKYLAETKKENELPDIYYLGSQSMYKLTVNDKYIGTFGSDSGNKNKATWKLSDNGYMIDVTDNYTINLAESGIYLIELKFNYFEDGKALSSYLKCRFKTN